jgi:hypothetical protein
LHSAAAEAQATALQMTTTLVDEDRHWSVTADTEVGGLLPAASRLVLSQASNGGLRCGVPSMVCPSSSCAAAEGLWLPAGNGSQQR